MHAACLRTDPRSSGVIGMLVKGDAKPGTACADARAYFRRMLADASRKHETIETSERSCQRANLACGPEYEQVNGFVCTRIAAGQQCTHIARNPGYAHEPAATV
jgi:hypothetical protein